MPKAIWKGNISFGLVHIPVTLEALESRSDLHFTLLDRRNKALVRYERINEATGEEVSWDQTVRAFEYSPGNYVVLENEELEQAAVPGTQEVAIETFVDLDAIPYTYFDKPYCLVPTEEGRRGYVLLREALRRTNKVGIAKVVIRTRQHLAALIPEGDALVLNLLRFAHELRTFDKFDLPTHDPEAYGGTARELELSERLIQSMTEAWDPQRYHDEYREALQERIERKALYGAKPLEEEQPSRVRRAGEVVDIGEALKRSVDEKQGAARQQRAGGEAGGSSSERRRGQGGA